MYKFFFFLILMIFLSFLKPEEIYSQAATKQAYEYLMKGNDYLKEGYLNKALETYNKAITISPEFSWAHLNISLVYYKLGNNKKGLEHMKIAAGLGERQAQKYLESYGIDW